MSKLVNRLLDIVYRIFSLRLTINNLQRYTLNQFGVAHLLLIIFLVGAVALGVFLVQQKQIFKPHADEGNCVDNLCPANLTLGSFVVDSNGDGSLDATIVFDGFSTVSLKDLDGTNKWTSPTQALDSVNLVAAGDYTNDGIPDYIIGVSQALNPLETVRECKNPQTGATKVRKQSALVFLNGLDGETMTYNSLTTGPIASLPDWCFNGDPYPQWALTTAYIGNFKTDLRGNEVTVIPYYSNYSVNNGDEGGMGWVLNYAQNNTWQIIRGRDNQANLWYPSVKNFDLYYNRFNTTPCIIPPGGTTCYVADSQPPNGIFVTSNNLTNFFLLTSLRAILYKPDLSPASDTVWKSGNRFDHGGRNYGLVQVFLNNNSETLVNLIGGCSTLWGRNLYPHGICGIHHHYELFSVAGDQINHLTNLFYSYSLADATNDPYYKRRLEYPGNANAFISEVGKVWTLFNLYKEDLDGGKWSIQIFTDPKSNGPSSELPGYYLWDTADLDGDSLNELIATKVASSAAAPLSGYDVQSDTTILKWTSGCNCIGELFTKTGVKPVLVETPSTEHKHNSETGIPNVLVKDVTGDGKKEILVQNAAGEKKFLNWNQAISSASPTSSPTGPVSPTPTSTSNSSDINRDGRVNYKDALQVYRALGQRSCGKVEDINRDCRVNTTDVTLVIRNYGK